VAQEIARIESGEQAEVQGSYPAEIAALTGNLNTLIRQERVRQTRYKEALSFWPQPENAVGRAAQCAWASPTNCPMRWHSRSAAWTASCSTSWAAPVPAERTRFAPRLTLAPVVGRMRDSLAKVYADKQLAGCDISVDCPPDLSWRMDEGDAFELLGNLMDNAAKWATKRVSVRLWREAGALRISVHDDGPGFTDTHAVLQLHVRMDEKVPGHGVGLAVVNDLVASHEGTLTLGASAWGGAQVDVVLPSCTGAHHGTTLTQGAIHEPHHFFQVFGCSGCGAGHDGRRHDRPCTQRRAVLHHAGHPWRLCASGPGVQAAAACVCAAFPDLCAPCAGVCATRPGLRAACARLWLGSPAPHPSWPSRECPWPQG
jgi:hypothetical protein